MIKITEKVPEEQKKEEELEELLAPSKDIRTIALFGDVDEEKAGDICMSLLMLTTPLEDPCEARKGTPNDADSAMTLTVPEEVSISRTPVNL